MSRKQSDSAFCGGCGSRWPGGARFCPSCGQEAAPGQPVAPGRSRATAVVVCSLFVLLGAAFLFHGFGKPGAPARAVPGRSDKGAQTALALPAGHPDVELPAEVGELLDELARKAKEAPADLKAWQQLARARYRAGLLNSGYYQPAAEALDHVLELDPGNLEAIRSHGDIAYETGHFDKAESYFARYLEGKADDPEVRTDLASTLLFQKKVEQAEAEYRRVIKEHPDFVQAHVNLGIALHSQGRQEAALASLKKGRSLAKTPEQAKRIDEIIALAEGRQRSSAPARGATATGSVSNASSTFQQAAEDLLRKHPILGGKIARVRWTGPARATVYLSGFPMDKMPPVVRERFKSRMNASLAGLAGQHEEGEGIHIDLVDEASGTVMDTLGAGQGTKAG